MEPIRKILYPTRFDPLSFRGVEALYPLRSAGLEEIVLLFVVDREEVAYVPYGGYDRKLAEKLTEEARLRLADWGKEIEQAGLRFRSRIETGRPATRILEVAVEERADLIVTGRHRPVPLDAVYLGGTAMEILRRSPVPVLVYKPGPSECGPPLDSIYERLLYPTDFTDDARPALELGKRLAGVATHVDVLHVIREEDVEELSAEELKIREELRAHRLADACAALGEKGLTTDAHLRAGDVDREILTAAADLHSTCILMGTTEKEGLRELWLGSVSHRVAELATVSVLLVPAASPGA